MQVAAVACGSTRTNRALSKSTLLSFVSMRVCYDVCSAWTKRGRRKPFQASPPSVLAQSCLVQVMPMHALRKSRYQPITLSHPRSYIASSASFTTSYAMHIMVCMDVWSKLVLPGLSQSALGPTRTTQPRRRQCGRDSATPPRGIKHALPTKCTFGTNLSKRARMRRADPSMPPAAAVGISR